MVGFRYEGTSIYGEGNSMNLLDFLSLEKMYVGRTLRLLPLKLFFTQSGNAITTKITYNQKLIGEHYHNLNSFLNK